MCLYTHREKKEKREEKKEEEQWGKERRGDGVEEGEGAREEREKRDWLWFGTVTAEIFLDITQYWNSTQNIADYMEVLKAQHLYWSKQITVFCTSIKFRALFT